MTPDNAPELEAHVPATSGAGQAPQVLRAEHRLPVALTVLVLLALPFLLPDRLSFGPKWLLPALAALLLIAIVGADPGRITRRSTTLRVLAISLVLLLIVQAGSGTVHLIIDLLQGGPETNNATLLLVTGGLVWIGNNLVFALLYWELDSGGPAVRAQHTVRHPDLAFPGHLNPEVVPPNWRPVFVDYLYLGLTNALAFSPTDVMPISHWAKLSMALQSMISIVVLSLVIARAVNILK